MDFEKKIENFCRLRPLILKATFLEVEYQKVGIFLSWNPHLFKSII